MVVDKGDIREGPPFLLFFMLIYRNRLWEGTAMPTKVHDIIVNTIVNILLHFSYNQFLTDKYVYINHIPVRKLL